jgi:hypothetical protein
VSIKRWATKKDANHKEIVQALKAAGASVEEIERPVDLLVGFAGQTTLMEVKNIESWYGRKGANDNQSAFMSTWRGGAVAFVDSIESALRVLEVMRCK